MNYTELDNLILTDMRFVESILNGYTGRYELSGHATNSICLLVPKGCMHAFNRIVSYNGVYIAVSIIPGLSADIRPTIKLLKRPVT